MSHLKKLSHALKKLPPAQILPISVHGISDYNLELITFRHTTITKSMLQFEIPSLLQTIEHHGLASLSSNQCMLGSSFFLMHSKLQPDKWTEYSSQPSSPQSPTKDYKVIINPSILEASDEVTQGFEFCPSLPNLFCQVERSKTIQVEYMNQEGDYIEEELSDFDARVFQHEFDHLSGFLMTNFSVSFGRIHSSNKEKTKNLLQVLQESKEKVEEVISKYEKVLLKSGHVIGKKGENKERQFIERVIFDEDMEEEFRDLVHKACSQDYS